MLDMIELISIHKALAGLDKGLHYLGSGLLISIHKALAGLDAKELMLHD